MDGEWSFLDNDSFGFDWFIDDPFEHAHDQSLTQSQNQLPPQLALPQVTPQPLPQPQIDFQQYEQQQKPDKLDHHPESQRTIFKFEFQREISRWFMQNINILLQTKDTEEDFIIKYELTRRQVKTAFNNRRQRMAVPFRLKYHKQIKQTVISQLQSLALQLVCADECKYRSVNLWIVECLP
jgi:hypothetical protein